MNFIMESLTIRDESRCLNFRPHVNANGSWRSAYFQLKHVKGGAPIQISLPSLGKVLNQVSKLNTGQRGGRLREIGIRISIIGFRISGLSP